MRASVALLLTPGVLLAAPLLFDLSAGGNAAQNVVFDPATGFGFEPGTPGRFSVRVPEGNYRVTLHYPEKIAPRVYAEQRRWLGVAPGDVVVNVRTAELGSLPPNATGGTQVRLKPREVGASNWDDRLTLQFEPANLLPDRLVFEAVSVPTLYLAGDSTVTDQPIAPNASWGQRLPALFRPDIAVANHAES